MCAVVWRSSLPLMPLHKLQPTHHADRAVTCPPGPTHPHRAKRLSAALATWSLTVLDMRRLLAYPCQVHVDTLRAAEAATAAAAAPGAFRQPPPPPQPPPPRSVGGFLKQRLPPLLRELAAAARCLLADLPSAAWVAGSSSNNNNNSRGNSTGIAAVGGRGAANGSLAPAAAYAARADTIVANRDAVQGLVDACAHLAAGLAAASAAEASRAAEEVERRGGAASGADTDAGGPLLSGSAALASSMLDLTAAMERARRALASNVPMPNAARSGGGNIFG